MRNQQQIQEQLIPEQHVQRQTSYLGVADAPTFFINTLHRSTLFINRERSDLPNHGMTPQYEREDAFAVYIHLRDFKRLELWCEGRPERTASYRNGAMIIYDLERAWRANMLDPFDCLHLHVSRAALDEIADDSGAARIDALRCPPHLNTVDPVVNNLAHSLLPALQQPEQTNQLFLDHAALALHAHLAHNYGGMREHPRATRGGLAPWQERRAKELLSACFDGDISLTELARECNLSRSHFARAFRQTTGQPPHRWLLERRLDRAKDLLLRSTLSLADIAIACGFADQSHFTRVFSGMFGDTPGAWRRAQKC